MFRGGGRIGDPTVGAVAVVRRMDHYSHCPNIDVTARTGIDENELILDQFGLIGLTALLARATFRGGGSVIPLSQPSATEEKRLSLPTL